MQVPLHKNSGSYSLSRMKIRKNEPIFSKKSSFSIVRLKDFVILQRTVTAYAVRCVVKNTQKVRILCSAGQWAGSQSGHIEGVYLRIV
jgi:hypothetical protein